MSRARIPLHWRVLRWIFRRIDQLVLLWHLAWHKSVGWLASPGFRRLLFDNPVAKAGRTVSYWCVAVPSLALLGAAGRWISTRRMGRLLVGSPAILVAGLVVVVVVWQTRMPAATIVDSYRTAMGRALASKDLDAAELYLRKLLQLGSAGPEAKFALAEFTRRQGDTKRADEILAELAPRGGIGYAPAHFALARELARSKEDDWTDEDMESLVHHLRASASSPTIRTVALQLLAEAYLAKDRLPDALEAYRETADRLPAVRLPIAHILIRMNKSEEAKAELSRAISFFEGELRSNPEDVPSRIGLAKSVFLTQDFSRAASLLQEKFASADGEQFRSVLAGLYAMEFDRRGEPGNTGNLGFRIQLLRLALDCWPNSPEALVRLAGLASGKGASAQPTEAELREVLAAGIAPGTVHLILGAQAGLSGNRDSATMHFEQAGQLDQRTPQFVAHVASILLARRTLNREQILQLLDAASAVWPDHAGLRTVREQAIGSESKTEHTEKG